METHTPIDPDATHTARQRFFDFPSGANATAASAVSSPEGKRLVQV